MITAFQAPTLASSAASMPTHAQPASGPADTLRRWWHAMTPLVVGGQTAPLSFENLEPVCGPVPDWQIPAYLRKARSGDSAALWVSKRH